MPNFDKEINTWVESVMTTYINRKLDAALAAQDLNSHWHERMKISMREDLAKIARAAIDSYKQLNWDPLHNKHKKTVGSVLGGMAGAAAAYFSGGNTLVSCAATTAGTYVGDTLMDAFGKKQMTTEDLNLDYLLTALTNRLQNCNGYTDCIMALNSHSNQIPSNFASVAKSTVFGIAATAFNRAVVGASGLWGFAVHAFIPAGYLAADRKVYSAPSLTS